MATMFRPTVIRFLDKAGKQVPKDTPGAKRVREKSKTWRGRYTDSKGAIKSVTLFDSKELSKAKFAAIIQRVREELAGVRRPDPFEEQRETPLICSKCKGSGCKDDKSQLIACEQNHLAGFREHLEAKGSTTQHVALSVQRILTVFQKCGFKLLPEIAGGRVLTWLKDRRQAGLSPASSNHYLTAMKAFGNWLLKDRRSPENPFVHLSRVNAKVDVRCATCVVPRRTLTAGRCGGARRSLSRPHGLGSSGALHAGELHRIASFRTGFAH